MPMHKRKWLTDVYYIIMGKTRSIQSGERSKYKTNLCNKTMPTKAKDICLTKKKTSIVQIVTTFHRLL